MADPFPITSEVCNSGDASRSQSGMRVRGNISGVLILASLSLWPATDSSAGIVQWRVRVAEGAENPNDIGSYANTIEIGNGGTTNYDPGLDVELDTSIVPNTYFFVSYIDQDPARVEYEFAADLDPGESYTARLSFENPTGGFFLASTTVEFLASHEDFNYELSVDSNDNGSADVFRSGTVQSLMASGGEMQPWNQLVFQGNDHRHGWYFGEITLTLVASAPGVNADFDGNQLVDGADLMLWEVGFGTISNAAQSNGNSDADEDVDGRDFLNWQRQFSHVIARPHSTQSYNLDTIPEPSSATLGLAAVVTALLGQRPRRTLGRPQAPIA